MIGEDFLKSANFLNKIKSPEDLKELSINDLNALSAEIRELIISTVSENGGHLSSNLGVVELSVALHKTFSSPDDKIIWDVGHQVYAHKILTGRAEKFSTLRREDGISGFSSPAESGHDIFYSGHSSTSISSALGIAVANKLNSKPYYTVAVIGDGALTGGMAYEALNNAGRSGTRLIVILNDNEMSISQNVGSVARYLAIIRSKPEYFQMKARTEKVIRKIPVVGEQTARAVFNIKTKIKNSIYRSTFFEELGFRYMGPIDGHNIEQLCEALNTAKLIDSPVLLHISTVKGKGYPYAENNPSLYHGVSKFDMNSGNVPVKGTDFSEQFGKMLSEFAEKDSRICAVSAAMALGTGLGGFSEKFSDRFFDVGIAEEHAVTFAGGLAKGGMIPVVALYSTFLQRAYDQLVHDGTLQKQKMIIAVDRAGFVGEDGVTHQGLLDTGFLNSIPGITVYSPYTYERMRFDFENAVKNAENLTAIRYPRGGECALPSGLKPSENDFDLFFEDGSALIITYGRIAQNAARAAIKLKADGKPCALLVLNKIKPINPKAVESALNFGELFFFEETEKSSGIGQSFADLLLQNGYKGNFSHTAVNDEFAAHAPVLSLMKKYGLDSESIYKKVSENLNG